MADPKNQITGADTVEKLGQVMGEGMDQQVETVSRWVDTVIEFGVTYGFQLIGALVFLAIGLKAASWAGGRVAKILEARKIDVTLARFIGNVVKVVGNVVKVVGIVFLVIITLGNFGRGCPS